jgi:hypothetical protein
VPKTETLLLDTAQVSSQALSSLGIKDGEDRSMIDGSGAGWVRNPQWRRIIRASLELAIFAFVLGFGVNALHHLDHELARIVLSVYVPAIGAFLAVHYGWGKKR